LDYNLQDNICCSGSEGRLEENAARCISVLCRNGAIFSLGTQCMPGFYTDATTA